MKQRKNSLLTAAISLCPDVNTLNASAHGAVGTVGGLLTALTIGAKI
jgi:hypothetical protein